LRAEPPRRLSYLIQSGPHDPATFLTWLLRAVGDGTTLRLQIDEIDGSSGDEAGPCRRCDLSLRPASCQSLNHDLNPRSNELQCL
jgi:hypothetical protein